jgi:AbrB family looped-hinge helix DNA binding protein
MNKKHIGSNFDDFLREEKIYKRAKATAVRRLTLKVNAKHQITIPKYVREKLNMKAGDSLLMDVQDGMMILIPQGGKPSHMQGLHNEIWKDVDVQRYINAEREAWNE